MSLPNDAWSTPDQKGNPVSNSSSAVYTQYLSPLGDSGSLQNYEAAS